MAQGYGSQESRLPSLDGLRGVAILLVLAHQLLVYDDTALTVWGRRAAHVLDAGWSGVTLFFVLSGFLITQVVMAHDGAPGALKTFYARRALRTVPLCYVMVFLAFVLFPYLGLPRIGSTPDHPAWYLLFVSNWAAWSHAGGSELPSLWSLGVEEQFYLFWPILIVGRSARFVMWLSLGSALASATYRVIALKLGLSAESLYHDTLGRMDALAVGAFVAAAVQQPPLRSLLVRLRALWVPLALSAAIVGAVATHGFPRTRAPGQTVGYACLTLCFAGLLAAAVAADMSGRGMGLLRLPLFRSFGRYSYSIYLFHHPLHTLAGPVVRQSLAANGLDGLPLTLTYMGVGIGFLYTLGWLSWNLVEAPCLSLRPPYKGSQLNMEARADRA